MSQRNAEQVSEAILKAVLRKNIDEQVIGDVSAQELVGLVANNFSSCPACGAEPWTNIDCRVCEIMGVIESTPKVDQVAAERARIIKLIEVKQREADEKLAKQQSSQDSQYYEGLYKGETGMCDTILDELRGAK